MAKKKKERKIPEVIVFSDINNYPDDLASMVVLAYLSDQKQINLKGIITEFGVYETRRRRAMYAKGAMSCLGLPYVRVVPGGDYQVGDAEIENHYPETEWSREIEASGTAILRNGTTFLQEYVKGVKDKNIVLLLNAPFMDFVRFINATHDTVKKKFKKIVIMGDVLPQKAEDGSYLPNPECFNFKYGYPAAETLFKHAQENDIRLVIVPKQSVCDMHMKYEFLEGLEKSKSPIAKQLLSDRGDNPLSMQYDMLSALSLADGLFKAAGGAFEKEEDSEKNVFFAKVADAQLMREKFAEIFKNKLLPKKITLADLMRPREEPQEEN